MKVTLVVPTKNEIVGMRQIMPRIKKEWVDEIIVVDAGSDGTYEYALEQGYRAIKQKSKGVFCAYREVAEIATGDVFITFSPDGNSIPELIPELVAKMREGYDMVIVSRYAGNAKSEDDDVVTAFGNWMFTTMINVLFRARYTDTLVMFRAWKKELLLMVPVYHERMDVFEPLATILCAKRRLRVADIPGDEPARIGGIRKMNPLVNGFGVLTMIGREFIRR